MSNPFEIFDENIWVAINVDITKTVSNSSEKYPVADVIIKNQKESPDVTAIALNFGEDSSMLNRVDKCHQS